MIRRLEADWTHIWLCVSSKSLSPVDVWGGEIKFGGGGDITQRIRTHHLQPATHPSVVPSHKTGNHLLLMVAAGIRNLTWLRVEGVETGSKQSRLGG